ncbi:MAG: TonB-dependent receptor, partial [Bacteroidetes bacterium]|nr:TonB-dependent receptor [Bacteroidota bacterium]
MFAVTYHPFSSKASTQAFIADINRNSGVVVEYASSTIDTARIVTLVGQPATVGAVLQQVLRGEKLSILQKNNKIILSPSQNPLPDDAFVTYYSVYGIVKEAVSQEPLAEATIWSPWQQKGTFSNSFGYFTLLLPEGKNVLQVSYAGYTSEKLEVDINDNTRLDVLLQPKSDFETVTITTSTAGREYTEGVDKTDGKQTPYGGIILGEEDVLRSLYMQPGIKNITEITNGVLVRGGSPDQNIFLLDGSPVFNPTHLLGTLSIVNKTSLKSMNLYKSNFPARYGGGLSSVIDVFTKDGNMKEWKGEINAGLLAGSFTVEGPVKKDRAAMMLSVRNSWVNPFLRLMHSNIGINFYDVHFKYTQLIGEKDKLMLNVYAGHDKLSLEQDNTNNQQQWGNKAISLTWNRVLGAKAFVNTSLSVSDYDNIAGFKYALYDSATGNAVQNKVYSTFSSLEQYNFSTQLELTASNTVKFQIGGKASYTRIKP